MLFRTILCLIFLTFGPGVAYAIDPAEMFDDPAMEERARDLGRELRCVKCRNQSIFDSNAGIAKDLRMVVRERIVAGDTGGEPPAIAFDPSPICLVATTRSLRRPVLASQFPMISSVRPQVSALTGLTGYICAVSRKSSP